MLLPSWPFGTAAERAQGGIQLRLLWDSVLPYSTPTAPVPVFWIPDTTPGQFEGWERNFQAGPSGALNFPDDRHLNAVLPAMIGLKDSETAPNRLGGGAKRLDDDQFPFDGFFSEMDETKGGALRFLIFYVDRFCEAEIRLVIQIPERDIMNVAALPKALVKPDPDHAEGEEKIESFVRGMLLQHGERIIAWSGVDELDVDYRVEWYTDPVAGSFNLAGFVRIRMIVRETERQWRKEADLPPGFENMPPEEQDLHLLPFITTFSHRIFSDIARVPPFPTIAEFVNATDPESPGLVGIADMYFYDHYPYRRTNQEILTDFAGCDPPLDALRVERIRDASITDPMRTLREFIELRNQINPGLRIADPGWRHVGLWGQNAGAPFRPESPVMPTSAMEPAPPPNRPSVIDCSFTSEPPIGQLKRFPTREELRFSAWTALLELACGVTFFNMQNAPDDRIEQLLAPVMAEMEYFEGLRARGIDQTALMQSSLVTPRVPANHPQESLPCQYFLWQYQNAPSGAKNELWLCCVNRTPVSVGFLFQFPDINPFPGKVRAFQERHLIVSEPRFEFLAPVRLGHQASFGTVVKPFRMRLFKMVGV